MKFTFYRNRIDKISRQQMPNELENIAKRFNYIEFSSRDFDKYFGIHSSTLKTEFGNWKMPSSA